MCFLQDRQAKVRPRSTDLLYLRAVSLSTHSCRASADARLPSASVAFAYTMTPSPPCRLQRTLRPQQGKPPFRCPYTHHRHSLHREAARQFGSFVSITLIASDYFSGLHRLIPIIPPACFHERLSIASPSSPADFAALCLAIKLVQGIREENVESMQTGIYVMIKSVIALLEGTRFRSLETIQCIALVSFYEMGDGLVRNVAVTIAAGARLGRGIGLHKDDEGSGDAANREE
jgi:hypothetical protein